MADDKAKKTKIDLKARLGRTTQMGIAPAPLPPPSSAPGAMPPAPASDPGSAPGPGSGPGPAPASRPSTVPASVRPPVPMGIAPPPGISQGIPLPPFGPQRPVARAAEPKPSAAQQTIKVEIGEEIHEERKKWRNRIMLGVGAGVVIGGFIGFTAGGSQEKGERAKSAARGAGQLERDVKAANDKLKELDSKLAEAGDKVKNKSFPEDLSTALGGLVIPFEPITLDNKGVNGMPPRLFKLVLGYTASVEALNKLRESMRGAAVAAKDPLTKAWKEEAAPVAGYSVVFRTDSGKVVADLLPNASPFPWKGDFPEKYKVNKPEGKTTTEKEVKRYQKGDLPGGDLTGVPIDPKTTGVLANNDSVRNFLRIMLDMRTILQGNKDNPTTETPGLLKDGEDLVQELHKASLNQ